jgi:hypothetical protein
MPETPDDDLQPERAAVQPGMACRVEKILIRERAQRGDERLRRPPAGLGDRVRRLLAAAPLHLR